MMWQEIILALLTALIGAISTVWAYWRGRRKQAYDNAKDKVDALQELDEIIDKQSHRINELQSVRLELEELLNHAQRRNKRLESDTETALQEIDRLLTEVEELQDEAQRIKQEAEELKQSILGSISPLASKTSPMIIAK